MYPADAGRSSFGAGTGLASAYLRLMLAIRRRKAASWSWISSIGDISVRLFFAYYTAKLPGVIGICIESHFPVSGKIFQGLEALNVLRCCSSGRNYGAAAALGRG